MTDSSLVAEDNARIDQLMQDILPKFPLKLKVDTAFEESDAKFLLRPAGSVFRLNTIAKEPVICEEAKALSEFLRSKMKQKA